MEASLGTKGDLGEDAGMALEVGEVGNGATEAGDKVGVGEVEALDCGDVVDEVLAQELLLGTPDAIFSLINMGVVGREGGAGDGTVATGAMTTGGGSSCSGMSLFGSDTWYQRDAGGETSKGLGY